MGKHYNNSQCFKEKKFKAKFLISSILKKKSRETILEKKITKKTPKKREKNHVGNTVAIHSVL
jgi:hypothetical protein